MPDPGGDKKYRYVPGDNTQRYSFLIVDDEEDVVEIIAETLKQKFAESRIYTATDGQQAMQKFRNAPPTMLITDLSMPKLSGNELLTNIMEQTRKLDMQVIIISGLSRDERYINEILNGRFRFLPKPFRANELIALVNSMLEKPFNPNEKFKLNVDFLNAFLHGAMDAFKKLHSIELKKVHPFVRDRDYISGDVSATYNFHTIDFAGQFSICFKEKDCLKYQELVEQGADEIDESLIEVIAHEVKGEIEERLLRLGFSLQLESLQIHKEPEHKVDVDVRGNTIVLPLSAKDWQVSLELTVG